MKASTFLNIRKHASRRKWDHVFVTSGKHVYLAVDCREATDNPEGRLARALSADVEIALGVVIVSGPTEDAAKRMKAALIDLGMLQGRVGAPMGNRNAAAQNREKTKAQTERAQKAAKR